MQYLAKGILPQKRGERYKLKKLATRYFCIAESFSRKGMMGTHYDAWVLRKQAG